MTPKENALSKPRATLINKTTELPKTRVKNALNITKKLLLRHFKLLKIDLEAFIDLTYIKY